MPDKCALCGCDKGQERADDDGGPFLLCDECDAELTSAMPNHPPLFVGAGTYGPNDAVGLVRPTGADSLPYVFADDWRTVERKVGYHAHIYRIEGNRTLTLKHRNPELLGKVGSPEIILLNTAMTERLGQAVKRFSGSAV